MTASLSHRNIVKVHDVDSFQGIPYIEMEPLTGTDFQGILATLHRQRILLPPDLVAALFAQACQGLHAAHQHRNLKGEPLHMVHRDISPSNLFCTANGVVKVIDFGIAWYRTREVQTEEGVIRCKPEYASPEQLRCEQLDHRTDLWSLGVVTYELLTGRPLFHRTRANPHIDPMTAILCENLPDINRVRPGLPAKLVALLNRALTFDRSRRIQSAKELGHGLSEVVRDAGGTFCAPERIAEHLRTLGIDLSGPQPKPIGTFDFDLSISEGDDNYRTVELPPVHDDGLTEKDELQIGYLEVPKEALHNRALALFDEYPTSLPAELLMYADPNCSLVLRLGQALFEFGARPPAIYLDPKGEWGKTNFISLPPDCEESVIAVGHRRAQLLTNILYARTSTPTGSSLVVRLPRLKLRIKTSSSFKSLVAFHIINPLDDLNVVQVLLIR